MRGTEKKKVNQPLNDIITNCVQCHEVNKDEKERIMGRPMLNKVFRRNFWEEVVFDILRTKKSIYLDTFQKYPFGKRRKEPFKHRGSMCLWPVARAWHVQTVKEWQRVLREAEFYKLLQRDQMAQHLIYHSKAFRSYPKWNGKPSGSGLTWHNVFFSRFTDI